MSAALKIQDFQPQARDAAVAVPRRRRLTVLPTPVSAPVQFPTLRPTDRPVWLRLLMAGQRVSLAVAALSVTGALSAYALTVNANQRLTVATETLGQLQDNQQQLTTANAVFKNHLAQTAIAAMKEGTLHPKDVIFLEAADPATLTPAPPPQPTAPPRLERRFFPKGY